MRKNYWLILLLLLGVQQSYAQIKLAPVPVQQVDQQEQNYLFAPLDKTQIPTGFLADYAIPLVPLDVFNGTLTDSSRTTPAGFRYLYGTAYSANITGTNPLPTVQTLNARIDAAVAASGSIIPVMVQRISYAAIRPDAFSANLLSYQNGQVYDVAGRSQSPYDTKMVFAAAPTTAYSASGSVALVFKQDLFLSNTGALPYTLGIDFGDGRGYVATSFDQPVSANYGTAGTKRIKVRAGFRVYPFKTTIYQESHFDLEVAEPACTNCRYASGGPTVSFPAQAGVHSGALVSIRYGGSHTQLTKPLIVVEGYDKHFIAPDIQKENYSIRQFLQEINNPGNYSLYNDLDNLGQYDIVFIDFNNGTDDLLRNAQVFEEVVNYVNANKVGGIASGQPNAVIGISMGGLISRYKLAEMTKAGRNPHTRLLILQDSPQRGANVPLGIQALSRQAVFNIGPFSTEDLSPELRQANLLLDEPATRQLLVHRATSAYGGFEANTFLNSTYRNMITFGSSQPAPAYRVVAVSQGSQCGIGLFDPYAELARVNGRLFISPLPWISRVSYETELVVNALPAGGEAKRISYMALKQRFRLLFGLFSSTRTLFQRSYTCPSGLLAWDGVPGGTEPVSGVPGGFTKRFGGSWLPFVDVSLHAEAVESFSFLPTASGLDAAVIDQNTLQNAFIYGANTLPTVDKFIAQESFSTFNRVYYNQPHTVFTDRNGQWIFNELEGRSNTVLNCTSQCNPYPTIATTGDNLVCAGTTGTVRVNPPFGVVTGWTVTPAGVATIVGPSSGSPTLTLAPAAANSSGIVTVTAQLSNGCFNATSTPIQVAIGNGQLVVQAVAPHCYGATNIKFKLNAVGVSNIQWYINGSSTPDPYYDGKVEAYVRAQYGEASVYVTATGCGGGIVEGFGEYFARPASGSDTVATASRCLEPGKAAEPTATISAYPNPAHEALTVARTGEGSEPIGVRLFDSYSRQRYSGQLTGSTLQVDTRSLAPGLYFLHITRGGKTERSQIVIK